jgi:putative oxidoreductase
MDIGLLLLRLAVGLTLAAHGAQKLFGWFGGPGLDGTGQFFVMLGFPPGRRYALMAGLAESGGGLSLALGFLTPAAVAIVVSVMLVAAVSVHIKKGFFLTNGGYEYTLVLSIAALAVAFIGPGSLSVDAMARCSVSGVLCGFTALLAGVVGGALPLIRRRSTSAVKIAEQP